MVSLKLLSEILSFFGQIFDQFFLSTEHKSYKIVVLKCYHTRHNIYG